MNKGRALHRGRIGILILALAAVAAGGAALGLILAPTSQPASLSPASTAENIPVTSQQFNDARNVELDVGTTTKRELATSATGRVTDFSCEAGGTFTSGKAAIWVDGTPVINLATVRPLWRDMTFDTKGEDVKALQAELRRLGKDVPDHGWFNWATWNAWREIVEANGGKVEYGALSLAHTMWLPEAEPLIESCDVQTGAMLGGDQPIATLPVALNTIQIKNLPTDAAAGDRVLTVDGVTVPVDAEGQITGPDDLAQLLATASYRNYVSSDGETAMTGTYALATPMEVIPVPPAAIYDLENGQGCVVGDGEPAPVKVVGSALGRSFVTFDEQPPANIRTVPDTEASCR